MITLTPSNTHPNTYSLNWQAQQSHTILEGLKNLIGQDDLMTDCTLASADGEYVQCHKLILTLCSAFFKDLFQRNRADKANTIIILGNVTAQNLKYLLQFMYQGKVDIPSKDVDSFLQAGNNLKIEGLIGNVGSDGESPPPPHSSNSYSSSSQSQSQNQSGVSQPSRTLRTFPSSSVSHNNQSNKYATPQEAPSHSHIPATSDPTPNKRARLTETSCSGSNSTPIVPIGQLHVSNPVIVREPVSHGVLTNQAATNSQPDLDPLNDASAPEQAIDFNPMKTEPIQVYHGYEDEGDGDNNESDMTHREGEEDEEDMYEGGNEDSYEIPQSALVSVSAPPPVAVPGSSAGSQLSVRPRGNLPGSMPLPAAAYQHKKSTKVSPSQSRAPVYDFFEPVMGVDRLFTCNFCLRRISSKGGTSNLLTHMRKAHPEHCETGPLSLTSSHSAESESPSSAAMRVLELEFT